MFQIKGDTIGEEFFSVSTNDSNYRNISKMGYFDVNTFLRPTIPVRGRFLGSFTSDLTKSADDVTLSFLSLLLLLLIEGLVTTLLLQSRNGKISIFGFAIKRTLELCRDFKVSKIVSWSHFSDERQRRRMNRTLFFFTISILIFTVIAEIFVLFLTSPRPRNVTNRSATLRIMQPVLPKWDKVYHHFRGSWNRPCRSGGLDGVNEGHTAIIVCIETDKDVKPPQLFERAIANVMVVITSRFHRYGADHDFTIGNDTTKYRTRAYYRLDDGRLRLMSAMEGLKKESEISDAMHKLLISYLCSAYQRETEDASMNLKRLNDLSIDFQPLGTEFVHVLPSRSLREEARSYRTVVEGILPQGLAAFHVAQNVFGGAAALKVVDGDTNDYFLDSLQIEEKEGVIWEETIRLVNWLSITIVLIISGLILLLLRFLLRPVSMAEIASYFVKGEVGAVLHRSPIELADHELGLFRIGPMISTVYNHTDFYDASHEEELGYYSQDYEEAMKDSGLCSEGWGGHKSCSSMTMSKDDVPQLNK